MRACRVDANHTELVEYFRGAGCSVLDVHTLKNCCDILISKNGVTVAIEIKDGNKPPSSRKLTKGELQFQNTWQGFYRVIKSIKEAEELIRILQ